MTTYNTTLQYLKIDKRNHVEKPLLDQFDGLRWEIVDLNIKKMGRLNKCSVLQKAMRMNDE